MAYVDGYVLVVPKDKVEAYKKMAQEAAELWTKHGALSYKECMGDDLNPDTGGYRMLTFPELIKPKPDETVWFSFIEYKSREHRDEVNAKVSKEMEQSSNQEQEMPFELERMAFGGFTVEVST